MASVKSLVSRTPIQLTLGVGLKDDATFDNFFPGANTQIINILKETAENKGEKIIYLYGSGGQGCTHLLQAVCLSAFDHHQRAVFIPLSHRQDLSPALFDGLEALDLICIDDLHRIIGDRTWEEAFFHLFNRIRDAQKNLVITSRVPPKALDATLPDLISRLTSGIVFQLHELSDAEKCDAFIMRAERRGMTLPADVAKFILTHCPRHMTTLFSVLDTLDNMSLAAQRKLTIPFVKSVLQM